MLETIFQDPSQRVLSKYNSQLCQINSIGKVLKGLTDEELRKKTMLLKQRLVGDTNMSEAIINEAFALVREASDRVRITSL